MADDLLSYEIFWTRDDQENDVSDNLHIRNRKPTTKMQAHHLKEARNGVSHHHHHHHQISEKDALPRKQQNPRKDDISKSKERPSLKDLRSEDKKRVANLIRELAKAGEEKEVAVEQLQVERLEFGQRMKDLQHQMDVITQEREIVQKQYLECQKMLTDYQKQLAEEQEKVSRMNRGTPPSSKARHSKHSSLPQGSLQLGKPQSNSPGYSQPFHHPTAHPQSLQTDTRHHHQPYLNGYPPPNGHLSVSHANHPPHGYQPLQFHKQQNGNEAVPSKHHQQNGLPYDDHPPSNLVDNAVSGMVPGDDDFQPILSSTHRPSVHQHHSKSRQRDAGHVSRLYGSTELPAKVTMSHPYPSSSPDFLLNGHSRTNSGEFQPLFPEPDNDSESSTPPDQDKNNFWPLHFDPKPNRTLSGTNVATDSHQLYNPQGVPPQSFHSMSPRHKQKELLKQRTQLEQEQAWLREKLVEQEELLALKQAQLTETELLYLRTGDESFSYNVPNIRHNQHNYRALNTEPPPVRRQVCSLFPGTENNPISTNFPPEEFDEFGQQKVLTESMHELGLGHRMETSHTTPHQAGQMSTSSLSSTSSKHRDRRRSPEQGHHFQRAKSSERSGRVSSRLEDASHRHIDGSASFHSASKSRREHRGSLSSSPSSISTSTSSSNIHHKVKHTSTSPLYRDTGTGPSPRKSLSPGKVQVTMAPRYTTSNRLSSNPQQDLSSRQQGNLPLQTNRQKTSPSRTPKRNALQLTDLIDTLDATSLSRTSSRLHNRTQNGPRGHPLGSSFGATPELFPLKDGSDTEVEQQESRMLEEVFFVV